MTAAIAAGGLVDEIGGGGRSIPADATSPLFAGEPLKAW